MSICISNSFSSFLSFDALQAWDQYTNVGIMISAQAIPFEFDTWKTQIAIFKHEQNKMTQNS